MMSKQRVVTRVVRTSSNRLPEVLVGGSLLVEQLHSRAVLSEIASRLRVQREGGFHGIDVVVFLLLLFSARERLSIKSFSDLSERHRAQLGALASRRTLPSASSVSRFLSAVEDEALREFIPWLLLEGAGALELLRKPAVMTRDCMGQSWHVFDFDPTTTVQRQRALPADETLPEPRRRTREWAAGYPGRKRGDVQLTRATLQHAGSGLWLGVWCQPGNGNWRQSSKAAIDTVARTCQALSHDPKRALVRADGSAGNTPFVAACEGAGVGYLTRWAGYKIAFANPEIRAHLATTSWAFVDDSRSGPRRQAADLGMHELSGRELDDEGRPFGVVTCRVVVSRFAAPEKSNSAGHFEDGWHYELFITNVDPSAMPAPEIVACYYQRTAIENRFNQEDRELGLDRVSSYHVPGQNLAALIGLFVWNLQVVEGLRVVDELPALGPQSVRVEAIAVAASTVTEPTAPKAPAPAAECEASSAAVVGAPDIAAWLATHPHWSRVKCHSTLTCPAGNSAHFKGLAVAEQRTYARFEVAARHCRGCPLREGCTASAAPSFRKSCYVPLTKLRAPEFRQAHPKADRSGLSARRAPEPPPRWRAPAAAHQPPKALEHAVLKPAYLRRAFTRASRDITIDVTTTPGAAPAQPHPAYATSSAQRQNRRCTWRDAIARYALPSDTQLTITITAPEPIRPQPPITIAK